MPRFMSFAADPSGTYRSGFRRRRCTYGKQTLGIFAVDMSGTRSLLYNPINSLLHVSRRLSILSINHSMGIELTANVSAMLGKCMTVPGTPVTPLFGFTACGSMLLLLLLLPRSSSLRVGFVPPLSFGSLRVGDKIHYCSITRSTYEHVPVVSDGRKIKPYCFLLQRRGCSSIAIKNYQAHYLGGRKACLTFGVTLPSAISVESTRAACIFQLPAKIQDLTTSIIYP